MKKIFLLAFLVCFVFSATAQHQGHQHEKQRQSNITELVDDLSAPQKRKIETISKESKEKVDILRARQRAVHDSIHTYMNREGDQSRVLYPLFDHEAQLQAAIDREMYAAKLRIDEVLTKEQRQALQKTLAQKRKHRQ